MCGEWLCRFAAAAKTFSTLLHLLTDSECVCSSEKCVLSVPSIVNIYTDCIAAHVEAALYDDALLLCDTVLSKCSSSLFDISTPAADMLLQSQCNNDASHCSLEYTRKRYRSGSSTDCDGVQPITNEPIAVQVALYKTEALLHLGRIDDALSCVDRLVSLWINLYLVQICTTLDMYS